jgi:hypothetical protein
VSGPVETERDALQLPQVQDIYDAARATRGRRSVMAECSHQMLCEALAAAGVELGAYDHRIVTWLAGYEPQAVAVIAGWIERAHQAGLTGGA